MQQLRVILALVINVAATSVVHGFSPCPPPRFDVFCDKIVGLWQTSRGSRTVEDVMRSCGGAIQGIRDNDFYLNRADDGFCYFDCGSYAYGPVDIATVSPSNRILVSVAMPNVRIWLSSHEGILNVDATLLPNIKSEADATVLLEDLVLPIVSTRPEFCVGTQLQCRMASPSQPWMMQRVLWESRQVSDEKQDPLVGPFQCWIEQTDDTISMGVSCESSGYVKEILRSYNVESGKQYKVTLQEGRLL
ncbi:hypothetical protein MHU86_20441 [Fragilaria crotonensis]|nr:hypothetical protein MHU86_20441 [Fragilaria crotonensis]